MSDLRRWVGGLAVAAVLGLALGCTPAPTKPGKTGTGPSVKDDHDEEKAPHGGTLFVAPGHKFHAELVVDKAGKKATVYLLDGKAKKIVPTKAETITLVLKDGDVKVPLKAEKVGDDPAFVGTHDKLAADLDMKKVEIEAEVDGKPYVFELD